MSGTVWYLPFIEASLLFIHYDVWTISTSPFLPLSHPPGCPGAVQCARPLARSLEPCCDSDHALSCVDVEVDPDVLLNDQDISINGVELVFSNTVPPHAR